MNYALSHKAVIRIDGAYSDIGFEAAGFGGQKTPQAGVRILYRYSPKLNWLVGYRYRDTESKGNSTISSQDSAFLVGLGGLTPGLSKVNGNIEIGVQKRTFTETALSADTGFFLQASLGWNASDKTRVTFASSKDFFTTPDNQSNDSTRLSFGLAHGFTSSLNGSVDFELGYSKYSGFTDIREDDFVTLRGGLNYIFSSRVLALATCSYTNRNSTQETSNYERFTTSFALQLAF